MKRIMLVCHAVMIVFMGVLLAGCASIPPQARLTVTAHVQPAKHTVLAGPALLRVDLVTSEEKVLGQRYVLLDDPVWPYPVEFCIDPVAGNPAGWFLRARITNAAGAVQASGQQQLPAFPPDQPLTVLVD